jgi:hypothetical protein
MRIRQIVQPVFVYSAGGPASANGRVIFLRSKSVKDELSEGLIEMTAYSRTRLPRFARNDMVHGNALRWED